MIAVNRKARHDYFIEDHFEAGLVLQGWEAKSLRDKGHALHESGQHGESVKTLQKAKDILGLK